MNSGFWGVFLHFRASAIAEAHRENYAGQVLLRAGILFEKLFQFFHGQIMLSFAHNPDRARRIVRI